MYTFIYKIYIYFVSNNYICILAHTLKFNNSIQLLLQVVIFHKNSTCYIKIIKLIALIAFIDYTILLEMNCYTILIKKNIH